MAQTQLIIDKLSEKFPNHTFEAQSRTTRGDRDVVSRLGAHGGKGGAFIEDIRAMMAAGEVRMVMHSLKDLPGNDEYYSKTEYQLGAFLKRDNPFDCLVLRNGIDLNEALNGGVIGTNSVRRKAFLRARYPNVEIVHSRGSILGKRDDDGVLTMPGRLEKLDAKVGQQLPYGAEETPADGLILAASGLARLSVADRIAKTFSVQEMCPAIGQGVVVVECMSQDEEMKTMLAQINDDQTRICCFAERSMLKELDGNCHSPIAGYSWISDGRLNLRGVVLHPDGGYLSVIERSSSILDPIDLGVVVAHELNKRGAQEVISDAQFYEG